MYNPQQNIVPIEQCEALWGSYCDWIISSDKFEQRVFPMQVLNPSNHMQSLIDGIVKTSDQQSLIVALNETILANSDKYLIGKYYKYEVMY